MTYGVAIKYYSGSATATARIKSSETECAPYLRVKYSQQIPDGVYAIKNVEYSTYMTVENGSISSGSYVRHKTTTDSPANTFDRSSLFKITGSNGAYIIRSMTNNTLTLDLSYVEIRTKTIPPRDEDVPNEDKFDIVKQGSSYLIYPYNSNKVILTIEPEGDPLCVLEKSTTQKDREMWTFEQYTGNHQIGATIFHPVSWGSTGIVNGITETVSVGGWSTYVDINAWSIDVIPGYEKLCDVKLNNAQNRITITTNNPGTIWLDVNNLYSDMTIANTTHFNFAIVPKEGTYYIQNVGTGRYIDLESASMASGAIIQQWNFHTEDQAKWIVEHVEGEGGYVRLKSLKSNLYIGVNPDDTSVICQYAANQYTLWMVDTTDDGNLKLTNKATNGTGNVLTVPLNQNLNGTNLTQIFYTNDENKRDEWNMYPLLPYAVKLEVWYDQAYNNRYENASTRISDEIRTLQEKYLQEFGLLIECTGITLFNSFADVECSTDFDSACTHANNEMCFNSDSEREKERQLLHHKNFYNVLVSIPFPNTALTLRTVFIGHNTCVANRNETGDLIGHNERSPLGISHYEEGLAMINNFISQQNEIKTVIHEFGHHYNVKDHYGGNAPFTYEIDPTGELGYSMDCVWGENRNNSDVLNNYTICDGCRRILEANIAKYNH